MIVNGVWILLIVGAYGAYRLGCWVHDLGDQTTKHENRGHS